MNVKKKLLEIATATLRFCARLVGGRRTDLLLASLSERLAPIVSHTTTAGEIRFFCPGELPEYRARTLLTKEPETIEWIDSFDEGEVFWDVGANVGVFTLYAATLRAQTVLAFEPSPANYYLLNRNIELSGLDSRVSAYCLAFFDQSGVDSFFMANTALGSALNSFGEPVDALGKPLTTFFRQAMIGFSIDDFIERFAVPFPMHIKIDVDGQESKILRGARRTLADTRLRSLAVELDVATPDYQEVIRTLEASGLPLQRRCQSPGVAASRFASTYNHFFRRVGLPTSLGC